MTALPASSTGVKRGRPISSARKTSIATGVHLRTVQRVLAGKRTESNDDRTRRRFIETFRNFATFCRENSPADIGRLMVTDEQASKLQDWNDVVVPWLEELGLSDGEICGSAHPGGTSLSPDICLPPAPDNSVERAAS